MSEAKNPHRWVKSIDDSPGCEWRCACGATCCGPANARPTSGPSSSFFASLPGRMTGRSRGRRPKRAVIVGIRAGLMSQVLYIRPSVLANCASAIWSATARAWRRAVGYSKKMGRSSRSLEDEHGEDASNAPHALWRVGRRPGRSSGGPRGRISQAGLR